MPTLFEPNQVQSAINPNTFTIQDAGIYSNAELSNFWNRVLYTQHSDTTLRLSGRTTSFDSLATSEKFATSFYSSPIRNRFNLLNVLTVGLLNHFLNFFPFVYSCLVC